MIKFVRSLALYALVLFVLLLAGVGSVSAQTTLTSTTLSVSLTDTSTKAVSLASASGISASTASASYALLIDRELMFVQAVNGTVATVIRGWGGTRASGHFAGATVYFGVPSAFYSYVPAGYCVRANLPYVPVIVAGDADPLNNGATLDCLGSQWVTTNSYAGQPVFGATVASATTIGATGTYFKVSGTTTIQTLTVPAGWAPGMTIYLEPTGLWSTNTSGNIGLATTGVVGKVLGLTWNGTKWQPSY